MECTIASGLPLAVCDLLNIDAHTCDGEIPLTPLAAIRATANTIIAPRASTRIANHRELTPSGIGDANQRILSGELRPFTH